MKILAADIVDKDSVLEIQHLGGHVEGFGLDLGVASFCHIVVRDQRREQFRFPFV